MTDAEREEDLRAHRRELPEMLRAAAANVDPRDGPHAGVTIHLSPEAALLLADDIEVALQAWPDDQRQGHSHLN